MSVDRTRLAEASAVAVGSAAHQPLQWICRWRVEKYRTADYEAGGAPYEVLDRVGNLLTFGGASALWDRLTNATPTVTAFDATNAHIGVGDSTTAAARTDTDLVATTNVLRKAMDTGYPDHTDGTADGADDVALRSVFGDAEANFAWNEWGVFNAATGGRLLNRKVEALGTKASGSTWTFTVTLSLA